MSALEHDLFHLFLHEDSVRLLEEQPALGVKALQVLARWASRRESGSRGVHRRWAEIIQRRDWAAALEPTEEGQSLLESSPLPTLLSDEERGAALLRARLVNGNMHPIRSE